jgi:crotonobetainyl-CoA:carnitine CoA-transferase CaiB-like acyl-CoA transferase
MSRDHRHTTAAPLEGVRVLDLSWGPVGAVLTMMLADFGAEVIRVDRPGGDPLRRAGMLRTWDRSKHSVVLDLHDAADAAVARDLAISADIVVDGLGAGRAEQLGLGEHTCRVQNPALVWCSLTDPQPALDDVALSSDVLAAAYLGVMAETGGHRDGPIFPGHPALTYSTGLIGAIATLGALRGRLVHGCGDHVAVSLVDGVLAQSTMEWWSERGVSFIRTKLRNGRLDMGRRRLLLQHYHCADGGLIQLNTAAPGAFGRAMAVFGLTDRISTAPPDRELTTELTNDDLQVLRDVLPAIVRQRPLDHWTTALWNANVACLPLQPPGRAFRDDQVIHAGVMSEVEDPERGRIEVVGPVIKMSASPAPACGPIERLGASTDEIKRTGWRAPGLGRPTCGGVHPGLPPLHGLRILELSTYFASPYANRLLGQLGADVVKLEPLAGDPGRALPDPCENAHGGKRSVALDLKSAQARDAVERLVRSVDVVQHNMRPGTVERLGLGEAAVRDLRADIIYVYGPGFGSTGPKAGLQSFAPLQSGLTGLMHMAGGEGNEPVVPFGNEDYYAGLLSAIGTLLALIHRDRTGTGQAVEIAQLLATVFVTSEYFLHDGQVHSTLPALDREQLGWSPSVRIDRCSDGWIAISAVHPAQVDALVDLVGGQNQQCDGDQPLGGVLEAGFTTGSATEWERRLRARGVPSCVVRETPWLGDFLNDPASLASGRSIEFVHRDHGRVRVIGDLVHLARGRGPARRPAPALGEHTDATLEELGLSESERRALMACFVAFDQGVAQKG